MSDSIWRETFPPGTQEIHRYYVASQKDALIVGMNYWIFRDRKDYLRDFVPPNKRRVYHDVADPLRMLSGESIWKYLWFHAARQRLSDRWTSVGGDNLRVPYWSIVVVLAISPARWIVGRLRKRSRSRAGVCVHCGYNLRATPQRCPECGRIA